MNQAGHWTNDELVATLYGVGPSGDHLQTCANCRARLAAMQSQREAIELGAPLAEAVTPAFLAAQRRSIYKRLDEPVRWWNSASMRRWAAGVTTAGLLCGTLFMYEQNRQTQLAQERINDAKLMQEVAAMANDGDVSSMAPLQGLFEQ